MYNQHRAANKRPHESSNLRNVEIGSGDTTTTTNQHQHQDQDQDLDQDQEQQQQQQGRRRRRRRRRRQQQQQQQEQEPQPNPGYFTLNLYTTALPNSRVNSLQEDRQVVSTVLRLFQHSPRAWHSMTPQASMKETLFSLLVKVGRSVFQRCVETTYETWDGHIYLHHFNHKIQNQM